MPEPEPLVRLFGELKNKMEEYDVKFRNIPSPQTSYEEDTAEVRARIDGMWVKLHTAQPSDVPTYQDKIVELSGRLKELELRHERHVSMEEKRYQDALQLTFDNLRTDLMDVMRPKERKRGRPPGSKSGRHGTQSSSTTLLSALSTPSSSQKRQPETQGTVTVALAATPAGKRKRSRETLPSPQQKRLKLDKDPVKTPHRHPRSSHKQPDDDTAPDQQGFEGITDPEPGEVYLAFWEYSKEWIPVLILPMKDLEKVGVQGTLESLNLADLLPICYDQDALTSERTWREGYKDGQPLVTEREFPAIYFEGSKFPVKSPVGWVAAKDLRKLDVFTATSALVPQIQMVRKFLKKREADEASKSGGKGPSRERDDSLHVEDLPRQSTPDVSNQDGEPAQESPAPETAEVPKTPTDGTQPAPGSTPEAQQRPQTPTSNEKSGSGAAPDEPKEQTSTRSTRSSPTIATEAQSALQKPTQSASDATASMDAQPGPPTSTGSTQSGLTTTAETQQAPQRSTSSSPDSTTSTGPQEPTGDTQPEPSTSTEVQSAPQKSLDTTPAPDAASMEPRPHIPGGSTESAPNAPATPDTDIPMGGLRQSMFKVEPNGNIIFISSSEHESEDDETSKVEVPKLFANAPLEPMDLASPAKQPSVVEEVGVYGDEEGPPQQCTASQSQSKTETHVDFGSSDAYMQLLRSSSEIFHTVTRPDAASHKAAEPGHGDPGVARHQSEAAVTVDPAQGCPAYGSSAPKLGAIEAFSSWQTAPRWCYAVSKSEIATCDAVSACWSRSRSNQYSGAQLRAPFTAPKPAADSIHALEHESDFNCTRTFRYFLAADGCYDGGGFVSSAHTSPRLD
ncbi:hypothetical protein ACHAPT_009052 [Fusarium lateritium]